MPEKRPVKKPVKKKRDGPAQKKAQTQKPAQKKTEKKNKGGRPKKQIDYAMVEKLASLQCTQEEIADVLDISRQTLAKDEKFLNIYKKGIEGGKISLRRWQYRLAEKGNPTMLVWLGKQHLGQKDKSEVENTNLTREIVFDDDDEPDDEE